MSAHGSMRVSATLLEELETRGLIELDDESGRVRITKRGRRAVAALSIDVLQALLD